ncbi:proteasome regulatory particle base subunit [Podila epicladia]|nr:proteasome regulatory particle base subunit [Podila epicladia]KAG0099748.1 proteasome regulatory particle base subunit [Podila epicladia]
MPMASVFVSLTVLLLATSLVATEEAPVASVPQVFRIINLLRTIDLTQTVVRETTSAAILNIGTEPQSEYYFPVDQAYLPNLSLITAENRKTKESLEMEKDEQYTNDQYQFYNIQLSPPLGAGDKLQVTVKSVLSNFIHPFPARIGQSEKQGFKYSGNAFALSAYSTSKQKTTVQTPGKNMQIHARPMDSKLQVTNSEVILGPFGKIGALMKDALQVEYEMTGPVIQFRELRRDVEVTHWGSNLAVEDHYNFINRGAGLKGQYIRKGARRPFSSEDGGNAVKAFVVGIPKLARDIYYRDDIGNISTSTIHHLDKSIDLSLQPRFPIFGGWNTTFYTGYNMPLDGFVHRVLDTEKYIMKMYLFDLIKESSYDYVEVRVVLPEGSKNVNAQLPFSVDSIEYSISKTYMDSAGRSTVTIKAKNLVEDHVQELLVEYKYPESAYLIKPLAAASLLMGVFFVSMVFSRLNLQIQGQWPVKVKQI